MISCFPKNTEVSPRLPVAVGLLPATKSEEVKGRRRKGRGAFLELEVCSMSPRVPIFLKYLMLPVHQGQFVWQYSSELN